MYTNQDIARYYDLSEVHYRLFWNLEKSRSLHYGYWDASTNSFHEALLNMNRVLAARACIGGGEKVLDAGCGVGGSALWLAQHQGCQVVGISLNKRQVEKATLFATEAGLQDAVKFEQKDYLQTGYPDETFDVVWAIESVCYAGDKRLFLDEAYRVLKKGGRLVMADFFKTKDLDGKAADMVRRFANSWAINEFATWENFEKEAIAGGFTAVTSEDAVKAIMPSARRLYKAFWIGKPAAMLYRLFRGKPTRLAADNVESAYLQYKTLKEGWWKYRIVSAEKK